MNSSYSDESQEGFIIKNIMKEFYDKAGNIWYEVEWEDGSKSNEPIGNINPQSLIEFKLEQKRQNEQQLQESNLNKTIIEEQNEVIIDPRKQFFAKQVSIPLQNKDSNDPRQKLENQFDLQLEQLINQKMEIEKNSTPRENGEENIKKKIKKENQQSQFSSNNNFPKQPNYKQKPYQQQQKQRHQDNKSYYKKSHDKTSYEKNSHDKKSHKKSYDKKSYDKKSYDKKSHNKNNERPHHNKSHENQCKKYQQRSKDKNKNKYFNYDKWQEQFKDMKISLKEQKVQIPLFKHGNMSEDEPFKIDGHTWLNKKESNQEQTKEDLIFKVVWKKRQNNEIMAPSFFMYQALNKSHPELITTYLMGVLSKKNFIQSQQYILI